MHSRFECTGTTTVHFTPTNCGTSLRHHGASYFGFVVCNLGALAPVFLLLPLYPSDASLCGRTHPLWGRRCCERLTGRAVVRMVITGIHRSPPMVMLAVLSICSTGRRMLIDSTGMQIP